MINRGRRQFVPTALAPLLTGVLPGPTLAQASQAFALAVLYPETPEPFKAFFARMLDGIDDRLNRRAPRIVLPDGADDGRTIALLRRRELRVVISLGHAALRMANMLDGSIDIVSGAVAGSGDAGLRATVLLSLAPDPALLFLRLKSVLPETRSVTVCYSAQSVWLLANAREAAGALGLDLRAHLVTDIKTAFAHYRSFFAKPDARDSLWLLQDAISADESTLLPLVMQQSWQYATPLFSSDYAHVRRGALFSLFPDNLALGRSLGALALGRLAGAQGQPSGTVALRDVQGAFNTRTASHLGIEINSRLRDCFALLLPERT